MMEDIFKFVAWCSAFTNMYIGAFVTRTTFMDFIIKKYGVTGQFVLFIFCEHLTVLLKLWLDKISSATPQEIEVQKERQHFIVDKMTEVNYVTCKHELNKKYEPYYDLNLKCEVQNQQNGSRKISNSVYERRKSLKPRRNSKEPIYEHLETLSLIHI